MSEPLRNGTPAQVLWIFLRLGLTSFGGPIAHMGYFRDEFVTRRRWLDDRSYADLVALCQLMPGPASSQVALAIGLARAGYSGALAAWVGFTLPSALALTLFAGSVDALGAGAGSGWLSGLKAVAVAVVAQALTGMARSLCPDLSRAALAGTAGILAVSVPGVAGQLSAIALGGLAGWLIAPRRMTGVSGAFHAPVSRRAGSVALMLFVIGLAMLPLLATATGLRGVGMFAGFYRAGALVFGGGHVVLPLLQAEVAGVVSPADFMAGYGAAQAAPGPLFTFAAYLGAVMEPSPNGFSGALICLIAIFLPSAFLVVGLLPFRDALQARPGARAAFDGAGAAVVGLLAAAFYDPVITTGIAGAGTFVLALAGYGALAGLRLPSWLVVAMSALGGAALPSLGLA